jgi:hypothetical protein
MAQALLDGCFVVAAVCGLWALYLLIGWIAHGRPDRFQ